MVVVYHPTQEMVADYLTKPLNGTPFRTHQKTIIGLDKILVAQYRAQYENAKDAYRNFIGVERDDTFSLMLMTSGNVGVC